MQSDTHWDNILKIKTSGRDDSHSNQYQYPYEPTPYSVLERLANEGYMKKKDTLIDYGCGKGRVCFFLAYQLKMNAIGIEFDERIYHAACRNKETAVGGARVTFHNQRAEEFEVPLDVNHCFFFNPFSIELLRSVMVKILDSYYEEPRDLRLYFYYPSDEYIAYLMQQDELEFEDEIECSDIGDGEALRERILIFRVGCE